MSWLNVNLNESLSSIKGQLTNLASNVLADASEDDSGLGKERVEVLQKLVSEQEIEIKRLQQENNDILKRISSQNTVDEWTWDLTESKSDQTQPSQLSDDGGDLESKIRELERERDELVQSLEQLDQDCQSTTDRLVAIKDELQSENAQLKLQQQDVAKENRVLKTSIEQELKRIKTLEYEKETRDNEIARLKALPSDADSGQVEAGDGEQSLAFQKYSDVLLDAMKTIDPDTQRWLVGVALPTGDDDHSGTLDAFAKLTENVAQTVMDYKLKCDSLRAEMKNVESEKMLMFAEKSNEIDKLITENFELTKQLNLRSEANKHFEQECEDLSKNNELLINRLEEARQSSMVLHTIPEMNEHLDSQLERCYKRIEQLEREVEMNEGEHFEELKRQLIESGKELEQSNRVIAQGEEKCVTLEEENRSLKSYVEGIRKRLKDCQNEKEELEDRAKLDSESIAEQSLNLETLQEKVEILTVTVSELHKDNSKYVHANESLERRLEEAEKEIMDLKEEMTTEIDMSTKKDEQMTEFNNTVDSMENNIRKLKQQVELLSGENEELLISRSNYITHYSSFKADVERLIACYRDLRIAQHADNASVQSVIKEKNELLEKLWQMDELANENHNLQSQLNVLQPKLEHAELENVRLTGECDMLTHAKDKLELQITELTHSRNEIIELVQQKHQESITYHSEIQRLQQLLSIESEKCATFETQLAELNGTGVSQEDLLAKEKEVERLQEQNEFLREKCGMMAESLLQEQALSQKMVAEKSLTSEREVSLQRQLDSLRQHLIDVEEMYTKEIQAAEAKCLDMQQKLQAVVEKEKNSSNRFTSANIRANQQVEALQTNLQLVTNQRDELKRRVSDLEDQMEKQNAALCNLQIVLEQFQRDKEKVIFEETERVRRQIVIEKKVQDELQQQINDLKMQLDDTKEGLKAAVRLSDQVESSKRQVASMKEEVGKLQTQLEKSEAKYDKLLNQADGRVEKSLIKNLVIGLVTCNNTLNKDQNQILKIISTVLDFNQQDIEKVHLNKKDAQTWFSSFLQPAALNTGAPGNVSLSQAFVKFLEAESKPKTYPNLLDAAAMRPDSPASDSASTSRKTSVRHSPLLLSEVVLPTFADFQANRNSSSILKNVLKDNSNAS